MMAFQTFNDKIPVQCVDNALGCQAVVVYDDQTYPLRPHEEGTAGFNSISTGPGTTDNSSVKVFHPAHREAIHSDLRPSGTDSMVHQD